jgi:hypothetical protein
MRRSLSERFGDRPPLAIRRAATSFLSRFCAIGAAFLPVKSTGARAGILRERWRPFTPRTASP